MNPWQFIKEARTELFKVVWPTRQDVLKVTIVVIAISLVVAIFLGAIDFGLDKLFKFVVDNR
ncbi:MAG: preprotein translocase subunit SecE [Candidatus Doudnabacteria bacterium]|nr:preprotein translocase subunit SecE [Candidatus Doudnabacteria bacterium]